MWKFPNGGFGGGSATWEFFPHNPVFFSDNVPNCPFPLKRSDLTVSIVKCIVYTFSWKWKCFFSNCQKSMQNFSLPWSSLGKGCLQRERGMVIWRRSGRWRSSGMKKLLIVASLQTLFIGRVKTFFSPSKLPQKNPGASLPRRHLVSEELAKTAQQCGVRPHRGGEDRVGHCQLEIEW